MGVCCERTSQESANVIKVEMPLPVRYQLFNSEPLLLLDVKEKSYKEIQVKKAQEVTKSSAIAVYPTIYFIGGIIETKATNKAWKGSASKTDMVEIKPMGSSRVNPILTVNDDFDTIFVVGGMSERNVFVRNCEKYDIEADTWLPLPSLKQRSMSSLIFLNSKLYAFDTISNSGNYSILDLSKDNPEWRLITISIPMKNKIKNYGLIIQDDSTTALIFGGRNENDKISTTAYTMDIETGSASAAEKYDLPISVEFYNTWIKCGARWFAVSLNDIKMYSRSTDVDNWVINSL